METQHREQLSEKEAIVTKLQQDVDQISKSKDALQKDKEDKESSLVSANEDLSKEVEQLRSSAPNGLSTEASSASKDEKSGDLHDEVLQSEKNARGETGY